MASNNFMRRCSISAGRFCKRGKIGSGLFLARAKRQDLLARIGDALLPQLLFRADRLQALLAEPHLALEAFKRGLGAGRGLAARRGLGLRGFECRFERGERSEPEQRAGDARAVLSALRARRGCG